MSPEQEFDAEVRLQIASGQGRQQAMLTARRKQPLTFEEDYDIEVRSQLLEEMGDTRGAFIVTANGSTRKRTPFEMKEYLAQRREWKTIEV